MDIGAGPGYFCYLCNYFGHEAEALDLGDHPVYNDLIPFLGIQRTIFLQLNRERDGKHYSKELLQHFVRKGGSMWPGSFL